MRRLFGLLAMMAVVPDVRAQGKAPAFKVIAFYTAREDLAHISFVNEANRWFPKTALEHGFAYDSTNDWTKPV